MTINTNHSSALAPVDFRPMLWANWMALRNGDLSLVEEVLAPTVAAHLPATVDGPEHLDGRQALVTWLSARHDRHPEARLTVEVGPIIGPELIAGRWTRTGGGDGLRPDRKTDASVAGVDIIRIDGDRIAEYWGHDDSYQLERCLAYNAA
ncbi:nuclear transport factor 2 family protein [Plantactinospora solaniradicis]|uniref:Nuclear transport factor 2 family protein n=1 Tax=Plantactinospora solaniradicis TaxID=1723736 RepID=A0ABW1KCG5_9ACTN